MNILLTFGFLSLFNFIYGSIVFLILDQPAQHHIDRAEKLKQSIEQQSIGLGSKHQILRLSIEFRSFIGAWTVWSILSSIVDKVPDSADWLFVCESETEIRLDRLQNLLNKYNLSQAKNWFLGHALYDKNPTIIHHYAFVNDPTKFLYPDFGSGFALSMHLVKKLADRVRNSNFNTGFSIDAKHELAMLIWDNGNGTELTHVQELCTHTDDYSSCATGYTWDASNCATTLINNDLKIAVKTCGKFHKKRIPILKQTWALDFESIIDYYSDVEDSSIPTVNIGLQNTERGHCGKTMEILKRFGKNFDNDQKWLGIVDDDTLLSVPRLLNLLNCYNPEDKLIICERYGYGFNFKGSSGYDYPTGGSGMFFTPAAVQAIITQCHCPSVDSPDDMILGMCASHLNITIVHSAALHQARPEDYSADYLKRVKCVSFHKFYEIDPVKVFKEYLLEHASTAEDKFQDLRQEL